MHKQAAGIVGKSKTTTTAREDDGHPAPGMSEAEVDRLWRNLKRSKALLPVDSWSRIDAVDSKGMRVARRATLRSAEFTFNYHLKQANGSREGAVTVASVMLMAEEWSKHLRALLEIAEAQALRVRMSLFERSDVDEVIAEAEREMVPAGTQESAS